MQGQFGTAGMGKYGECYCSQELGPVGENTPSGKEALRFSDAAVNGDSHEMRGDNVGI